MKKFVSPKLAHVLNHLAEKTGKNTKKNDAEQSLEEYVAQMRAKVTLIFNSAPPSIPSSIKIEDIFTVQNDKDNWQGLIRFFTPEKCIDTETLIIDVHGGGFIAGSVEIMQNIAIDYALGTNFRTASIEYRLAPEYKFPIPMLDVAHAIEYIMENSATLGINPERIILTGSSAGANLIVSACMYLRDEGKKLPKALISSIGSYTPDLTGTKKEYYIEPFGLTGAGVEKCLQCYMTDEKDLENPLIYPVLGNLKNLPPIFLFSASLDPLCDDSFEFAKALREQEQECYLVEMFNCTHGGMPFGYDDEYRKLFYYTAKMILS